MTKSTPSLVRLRLVATDPPSPDDSRLLFGLQDRDGEVDAVAARETTSFETHLEVIGSAGAGFDFRGDHVHGRKGDRFLYLSWGAGDGAEPFVMLARAKIKLAGIPDELLQPDEDGTTEIECRLAATNSKGQPASGTIKPPAVSWRRPD